MRPLYSAAAAVILLSTASCAQPRACTEIGAQSGVGVTVAADLAADIQSLRLKACWAEDCTEGDVQLNPGTRSVDEDCGGAYSAVCSATMEPDGTLVGFLDIPRMPEGELQITTTALDRRGAPLPPSLLTAEAQMSYPNGRDCPGEAAQLSVTLDRNGIRADPVAGSR